MTFELRQYSINAICLPSKEQFLNSEKGELNKSCTLHISISYCEKTELQVILKHCIFNDYNLCTENSI